MYTIRAYYLQYCGSYAPHRRRRTMDAGRWTMDAGPSTPYYKLTGELKILSNISALLLACETNTTVIFYFYLINTRVHIQDAVTKDSEFTQRLF